MNAVTKLSLLAGAAFAALALPAASYAAHATAAAPATGADVVVTANKHEEKLRNVAQSVTAVTAQKVEQLQAFNFADYAKFVPGLTLVATAPGQNQLILRGINSGGDGSTVGTYIDEAPYGSAAASPTARCCRRTSMPSTCSASRSTRGRRARSTASSSLGGLLKFVTNPPDPSRFGAEAELTGDEVDNQGGWGAKGMVNIPLGSTARAAHRRVRRG